MKVINNLTGAEIRIEGILALYTGIPPRAQAKRRHACAEFEKGLVDRIHPRELVLHELNLLHDGFEFWAKIEEGRSEGPCWLPVHIEQ
ncbi:MAG: hypothetical protein P8Y38_04030 [Deltaproteobacteria bacterium]|jgi:hypothetical protein